MNRDGSIADGTGVRDSALQEFIESLFGIPFESIVQTAAPTHTFLAGLGREALQLLAAQSVSARTAP